MILDTLDDTGRYYGLGERMRRGFEFLHATALHSLPQGRHEIDGARLFVIVNEDIGRGHAGARLETHRHYADIQVLLEGHELIGWRPLAECLHVSEPYDPERDIAFYADEPRVWLPLAAGHFVVFYPHDAHAPLAGSGPLRKAVVKVALD